MEIKKTDKIEINEGFKKALEIMENSRHNVFITGKAGTGKSTLLEYFRANTKKQIAVLAPTGVAALNVGGQTIHSFFGFKPDIDILKARKIARRDLINERHGNLYRKLDAVVIDEISMVRADLLDCVDAFLKTFLKNKLPFGGKQMIFIGDLYQLPPVLGYQERVAFKENYESEYFFSANVFKEIEPDFCELEKVYRQKDLKFIHLLNAVRNRSVTEADLALLNARVDPDFEPDNDDFYISLTPFNDEARKINMAKLANLSGLPHIFTGEIQGDFDRSYLPTDERLEIKIGSQIMMLNNDKQGRWVNGTVGKVIGIDKWEGYDYDIDEDDEEFEGYEGYGGDDEIIVELSNGKQERITPFTWKIFKYFFNEKTSRMDSKPAGSFKQYPMKLAWAVTIHKSQGKTFDKVVVDMGRGAFAHGQTYVALSRCTTLDGLCLKKPISIRHILLDFKVVKFLTKFQYSLSEAIQPISEKIEMIKQAISGKKQLEIIYLKNNDEKTKRVIEPRSIGDMEYMGASYLGVEAFCKTRKKDRVFRVDRILEVKEI